MAATAVAAALAALPADVDLDVWGANVRDWRTYRALTQRELAGRVSDLTGRNFGPDAISEIENGRRRPTDPVRIAIAAALDAHPFVLFPYPEVGRRD